MSQNNNKSYTLSKISPLITEINSLIDILLPFLTATALFADVIEGITGIPSHSLGRLTLDLLNINRAGLSVANTYLDGSQTERNDYDQFAREIHKPKLYFSFLSALLRGAGQTTSLANHAFILSPAAAGALLVVGPIVNIGASGISMVGSAIGMGYYSYKIHGAQKHKKALNHVLAMLAIYQDILSMADEIVNSDEKVTYLNTALDVKSDPKLLKFKKALIAELVKNNALKNKEQVIEVVKNGVMHLLATLASPDVKSANKSEESLQAVVAKDKEVKTLRDAIHKDAQLGQLKFENVATNKTRLFHQLHVVKDQVKLDSDKKTLEANRAWFYLGVTSTFLIASGLLLIASALALAHTPPLAAMVLTGAAACLFAGIGIATLGYNKISKDHNKEIANKQRKFTGYRGMLFNPKPSNPENPAIPATVGEDQQTTNLHPK